MSPAKHVFWDKTNLALFTAVSAARVLDFSSTRHFRGQGREEILLSNRVVDSRPLFFSIEITGVAASFGVSYWLHRTGHHNAERWVSFIHIGVANFGNVHNYQLRRLSSPQGTR